MMDDYIDWLRKNRNYPIITGAETIKELRQQLRDLGWSSEEFARIERALGESLRKKADERRKELEKQISERREKFYKEIMESFNTYLYETILQQLTEEES